MTTVLTENGAANLAGVQTEGEALWLPVDDVTRAIGWTMKPEGLCQDDICVAVPRDRRDEFVREDAVNVAAFWRHMDRPVLHDASGDTWMLGAGAAERGRQLETLEAPDFTLPDLEGKPHALSDYRDKRVFLTTWSSW